MEGLSEYVEDDIGSNLNETLRQYFNWYKIDNRGKRNSTVFN